MSLFFLNLGRSSFIVYRSFEDLCVSWEEGIFFYVAFLLGGRMVLAGISGMGGVCVGDFVLRGRLLRCSFDFVVRGNIVRSVVGEKTGRGGFTGAREESGFSRRVGCGGRCAYGEA